MPEVGRGGRMVAAVPVGQADEVEGVGLQPSLAQPPPDRQRGGELRPRALRIGIGAVGLAQAHQVVSLVHGQAELAGQR
jgi:hypothetical protein